jgi:MFS family permease
MVSGSPSARAEYSWKRLFAYPATWGITISAFFYSYLWNFCLMWLPSYLVMSHGFSFNKMGAYMALPLMGMAVLATASGRLSDVIIAKRGHSLSVRKGFVCTGFAFGSSILLIQVARSPSHLLLILVLSVGGLGLTSANYWVITQLISPSSMIGRVVGYQNLIATLGGAFASVLTGFLLGAAHNFSSSIVVAGVAPLIAAGAVLLLIRKVNVRRAQGKTPASCASAETA